MTPKQKAVYDAIKDYYKKYGEYPIQSSLARFMGLSRENIRVHLEALSKQDLIEKEIIELTKQVTKRKIIIKTK